MDVADQEEGCNDFADVNEQVSSVNSQSELIEIPAINVGDKKLP